MRKSTQHLDLVQFEIDGFVCHRGFDPEGKLFVDGPEEAQTQILAYLNKYGVVLRDPSMVSFIASIPPFGKRGLTRKKQAVLALLVEHEEDFKNGGMAISAELVQTVLATFEPIEEAPQNDGR
jgi:hypothetical protein